MITSLRGSLVSLVSFWSRETKETERSRGKSPLRGDTSNVRPTAVGVLAACWRAWGRLGNELKLNNNLLKLCTK